MKLNKNGKNKMELFMIKEKRMDEIIELCFEIQKKTNTDSQTLYELTEKLDGNELLFAIYLAGMTMGKDLIRRDIADSVGDIMIAMLPDEMINTIGGNKKMSMMNVLDLLKKSSDKIH